MCTALLALASACSPGAAPKGDATPASATSTALSSGLSCADTDVHTKHLNMFACATCHPCGGTFGFTNPYTFAGGTTTAGGTIVPRTATSPTTCAVACHFPKGGTATSIAWNTPGPLACTACHSTSALPSAHPPMPANATREDCQRCHITSAHMEGTVAIISHGASWMDRESPDFHAYSANADLGGCRSCHGEDLSGGVARKACAACHDVNLPEGVASWKVNCVMCHGGKDNQTGAPPAATWGHDAEAIRIGAHTKHVAGGALAPAFACAVCHPTPADALADGHMDGGTAEVTFSGIAATGAPVWNRSLGTCAVYCHGATLSAGGTNTAPSWTGGPAACGTCHGAPPPAPHPAASLTACGVCHSDTVAADGTMIPPSAGGKHLDGTLQVTGGHDMTWMDRTSTGFHAYSANSNLANCAACHGANLEGGSGRACATCHDGVQASAWGCTACHGGKDNQTAAPPVATFGNRATSDVSNIRIGAHTVHVTGNATSPALACGVCHVTPTKIVSIGHADAPTASIVFGGIAKLGKTPAWDRGAATCASTYCHDRGGTYAAPVWTRVGLQGQGCGACHGTPPQDSEHRSYHWGITCATCHPGASSTAVPRATHVNGVKNVVNPTTGATWTAGWTDCGPCHSY